MARRLFMEFMQLTREQYQRIAPYLPAQRGNVKIPNFQRFRVLLYMAEDGCRWRGWPPQFRRWHSTYMWMIRWTKNGVLDRVFEKLKAQMDDSPEALSMAGASIKVHPDGTGALKNGTQSIGKSSGGWNTKIHMIAASDSQAVKFALSPGNAPDAPEGRKLLRWLGRPTAKVPLLMDRAYEGEENRRQAQAMGMDPVVPPLKSRKDPWPYDRKLSRNATKWRGRSVDWKAIAECSPALPN